MNVWALWALAKLLPVNRVAISRNPARTQRRMWAAVWLFFGSGLLAFIWDWTASLPVTGAALILLLAGLILYAEFGARGRQATQR